MSFRQETYDPIIGKMRKGTPDDPYKGIIETLQIINGTAQLTEIPNRLERVIVTGLLYPMQEVQNGELSENTYRVDYAQGVVYFHSNINGQFLVFKYMGRGAHFFPATRIYLGYDTEYNTAEKKFKDIDREIVNQRNRVNTLIVENPQPSEIVDIRVDRKGKVYRVAKERVDATQKTVEDAFVDLTDHEFPNLKERVDSEQKKIEETYFGDDGNSYFSMRDRFDHTDLRIKRTVITATRLSEITNFKDGDLVHTLGFYKAGDGGAATYEITNDRLDIDGATIIELYGNLKAKLVYGAEINVKQFGAKGDGVYPDAPLIQKALDMALVIKNIRVLIPAGSYNLTQELYIRDATYVAIHPMATLIRNHTGNMIRNYWTGNTNPGYTGVGNFVIDGGIFDCNGNAFNHVCNAIALSHGKNVTIKNVTIKDLPMGHAIELSGMKDVTIDDCKFLGYQDTDGVHTYSEAIQVELAIPADWSMYYGDFTNTTDITVRDCTFGNSGTPGFSPWPCAVGTHGSRYGLFYDNITIVGNRIKGASNYAIKPYKFRNCIIDNNLIEDSAGGIYIITPASGDSIKDVNGVVKSAEAIDDMIISNNIMKNLTGIAVYVDGADKAFVNRVIISDNICHNIGSYGFLLSYITKSIISNNIFDNVKGTIFQVVGSTHSQFTGNRLMGGKGNGVFLNDGLYLDFIDNTIRNIDSYGFNLMSNNQHIVIDNNRIYNMSQAEQGLFDGILVTSGARNISIQNNIIRQESGYFRPRYGINIPSDSLNINIFNNDVRCNPTIDSINDRTLSSVLWTGAAFMVASSVVVPTKKLKECRNGWLLVWSDYDATNGSRDVNFVHTYIPKEIAQLHNGAEHHFGIISGFSSSAVNIGGKSLTIFNDKIVGSNLNGNDPGAGQHSKDVCLRYVIEF